jgi:outer membrane immunogenic protein
MRLKLFAAAIAGTFIAGSALAADLPSRAEPPLYIPPPVATWTGFYAGVNVGWASLNDHGSTFCSLAGVLNGPTCNVPVPGATTSSNGLLGGGQLGYNWQFNQFVAGFETDFQGSSLKGSVYVPNQTALIGGGTEPPGNLTADEKLSWLGTARGRLGFAVSPALLLYGTGGLAYGGVSVDNNLQFPTTGVQYPSSASATKFGWTAGGGVEYAFGNNWSVKLEGLFYDLGSISTQGIERPAGGFIEGKTFSVEGAIARVGLNYKFDWFVPPAPVVAKY